MLGFAKKHEALRLLQNPERNTEPVIQDARRRAYDIDEEGYVSFGDVARTELKNQCQYESRYVYGLIKGYPRLGDGLRWKNYERGKFFYHELRIHIDDIAEFVSRRRDYAKYGGRNPRLSRL